MTNAIRVHPMALLHPERLDADTRLEIEKITAGYSADKAGFFFDRLAERVGTIAAAFYPKPVGIDAFCKLFDGISIGSNDLT